MATSALVVSFVRQFFQYGEYGYSSLMEFFGSWLIHYFALFLGAIGYLFVLRLARRFTTGEPLKEDDIGESILQFASAALVIAVGAFLVAHIGGLPEGYLDE